MYDFNDEGIDYPSEFRSKHGVISSNNHSSSSELSSTDEDIKESIKKMNSSNGHSDSHMDKNVDKKKHSRVKKIKKIEESSTDDSDATFVYTSDEPEYY